MTTQMSAEDLAGVITEALSPIRNGRSLAEGGERAAPPAPAAAQTESNEAAVAAAVDAERIRIFAVIESEAGLKRPKAALQLAKAGLATAAATAILAALPEEQTEAQATSQAQQLGNALAAQMANPANSGGVQPEAAPKDARADRLVNMMAAAAKKQKGN